jgi:hypothetical protein
LSFDGKTFPAGSLIKYYGIDCETESTFEYLPYCFAFNTEDYTATGDYDGHGQEVNEISGGFDDSDLRFLRPYDWQVSDPGSNNGWVRFVAKASFTFVEAALYFGISTTIDAVSVAEYAPDPPTPGGKGTNNIIWWQ